MMGCDVLMAETLGDILGAAPLSTGECQFLVWAPHADSVKLRILNPACRSIPMERLPRGYFSLMMEGQTPCRYLYDLGGNGANMRPDPASRFQPEGVHGTPELRPKAGFRGGD